MRAPATKTQGLLRCRFNQHRHVVNRKTLKTEPQCYSLIENEQHQHFPACSKFNEKLSRLSAMKLWHFLLCAYTVHVDTVSLQAVAVLFLNAQLVANKKLFEEKKCCS